MRNQLAVVTLVGVLVAGAHGATKKVASAPLDGQSSIVIIFKDGHQQSFSMLDISRIEFRQLPPPALRRVSRPSSQDGTTFWVSGKLAKEMEATL